MPNKGTGTRLLNLDRAPLVVAMTPAEAAAALRISRVGLYRLLRSGALASYRAGRSRRISVHAIADYQRKQEGADAWGQHREGDGGDAA